MSPFNCFDDSEEGFFYISSGIISSKIIVLFISICYTDKKQCDKLEFRYGVYFL
jgi:hypothetical protein